MGFNGIFSDPHCRYLQVDLVLIRLVDIGFNMMLSDHWYR